MFSGFFEFPNSNMSFFAAFGGIFSAGLKDLSYLNHDASMYASCIGDMPASNNASAELITWVTYSCMYYIYSSYTY